LNINISPGFEVFTAKSDLSYINEYKWTYITKERKHISVLLSISALKDKYNNIYGYLGIAKDITQRKVMESQAKLASMGEMIRNIAHQWRQPLNLISTIVSGIKVKNEYDQLNTNEILPDMTNIIN
jgi:signal transduction histidine kinase